MIGELSHTRVFSPRIGIPAAFHAPELVFSALEEAGVPDFYPGFQAWFFGKVVPGLGKQRRMILAERHGRVAGLAICKRSDTERKLCTLWVHDGLRGRGIAGELAREAFDWLGTERPLFTVPDEHLAKFRGLVRAWRFPKPVAYRGLYRDARAEHVFNGPVVADRH